MVFLDGVGKVYQANLGRDAALAGHHERSLFGHQHAGRHFACWSAAVGLRHVWHRSLEDAAIAGLGG